MKSVIYKITNNKNKKIYIGSSLKGLEKRKNRHLWQLKNNTHHNRHIQNEYNKYGDIFSFDILEEIENELDLISKENFWIKKLNPEYNIMKDVKSHIGVKRSEDTCEKISNGVKIHISDLNKSRIGKKYTDEHKKHISEALKGKSLSQAHKEKLRIASTGKKQSIETIQKRTSIQNKTVLQLSKIGEIIKEWKSPTIVEIESNGNYKRKGIYGCVQGLRKTYKKFLWRYKD